MAATSGAFSIMCVCVLLLPAATGLQAEDRECAFTDHLQGAEPQAGPANELRGVVRDNGTVQCSRGSRCYGLWEKRADGEIHLVKQGCWTHIGTQEECHGDRCLVTATPSQIQNGSYRFCCCSRDMCNTNFTEAPPTADTPALRLVKTGGRGHGQTDHQPLRREETVLIALVTVAIAAVIIMVLFLGYRMMRGKQKHTLWALDVMEAAGSDSVDLDDLKLLELIGRGRYGAVFRGCLKERCVAVKLFSGANRHNFLRERSIYSLPLLQHDNIAHFLSADERTASDGRPEFLILMEFYPHGCLSVYLSVHTVDWSTCCRMTHGVTRGLSFLHTELYRGDRYKPAVAHRDVSSRNVLVRADLSCVLADFGLSMKLTGSPACCHGDDDTAAISEVGTVRYMAPEVLGGALNLRDCESALKQVDMYALGLLLWESFRRCTHLYTGEGVPEYQLAFQAELGNHPTLDQMQVLVCREKLRPRFPEAWGGGAVVRSLKETMEDCWDQDSEARLTAQCAEERLWDLTQLTTHSIHNLRNPSHSCWPQVGSASSFIQDLQVSVVKNLQGDGRGPVVMTTDPGAGGGEKTRKSINYEHQQQQSQAHSFHSDKSTTVAMTPSTVLTGGAVLQPLTQDLQDLDQTEENLSSDPSSTRPLPKQQNLPLRPTSLHLLPRTKDSTSASSRLKLGKLKSNHRQVETGVAKMNTVTVASAVEPHLVTTVTNNLGVVVAGGYSAGVPTLVTNSLAGGGRTNPAGPQLEEDPVEEVVEDTPVNLLHASPDEHEPLLRREQPPAETDPLPLHRHHHHHHPPPRPGTSSNSNNNNNRITRRTDARVQGPEADRGGLGPNHSTPEQSQGPDTGPPSDPGGEGLPSRTGQCPTSQAPPSDQDPDQDSGAAHPCLHTALHGNLPTGSTRDQEPLSPSVTPPVDPEAQAVNQNVDPSEPSALQTPGVLRPRAKRPERPCSLDLSSSDVPLTDSDGLSASGEKIKRRVKTPYTLKKWRPASWVVSTDTALDPDFDFNPSSRSQTQSSFSGLQRPGSFGVPRMNQSKSSMAVFLVGGGTRATTAAEPDGMTCF